MNPNIILDIKRNLMNSRNPRELCCIYIAVGCAAHMVKDDKLEDLYYHQYPKCLEILKNETNINIIHILIDPTLELPPFMTIDRSKGLDFIQSSPISYTSTDGRHIIYSVKEAINIECYNKREDTVDITQFLIELNKLAIDENLLLVYNDFTGRPNKLVAEYFDKNLVNNLDHIIYGLGARGDHGCYIDLLHPMCLFAYIIDRNIPNIPNGNIPKRDIVRVFNIYDIMNKKANINMVVNMYPLEHIHIITSMIESVLIQTIEYFNNTILCNLRILHQLLIQKTKLNEYSSYLIENIRESNGAEFKTLFESGEYKTCFEKIKQMYTNKLDIIIYLKQLNTSPSDLMRYIIDDKNEYQWYHRLKSIVL